MYLVLQKKLRKVELKKIKIPRWSDLRTLPSMSLCGEIMGNLHGKINAAFTPHQKSFFLKPKETRTENHSQTKCREELTLSFLLQLSCLQHNSCTPRLRDY